MATTTWLTAPQAQQAAAEIQQVLDKYSGRGADPAGRPDDAREVRLFAAISLVPRPAPGA
ncbi:MAG: hypothetical protein ACLP52_17645 [Streptosporangiaceae bacterium]